MDMSYFPISLTGLKTTFICEIRGCLSVQFIFRDLAIMVQRQSVQRFALLLNFGHRALLLVPLWAIVSI